MSIRNIKTQTINLNYIVMVILRSESQVKSFMKRMNKKHGCSYNDYDTSCNVWVFKDGNKIVLRYQNNYLNYEEHKDQLLAVIKNKA